MSFSVLLCFSNVPISNSAPISVIRFPNRCNDSRFSFTESPVNRSYKQSSVILHVESDSKFKDLLQLSEFPSASTPSSKSSLSFKNKCFRCSAVSIAQARTMRPSLVNRLFPRCRTSILTCSELSITTNESIPSSPMQFPSRYRRLRLQVSIDIIPDARVVNTSSTIFEAERLSV